MRTNRLNVFDRIRPNKPPRSVFDLSYEKKFTCDMGQLIPILCDEMIPNDRWDIGHQIVVRFNPMVAPVLHEINAFVHYFFVPYRLLDDTFEDFITGGTDGDDVTVIPRWEPTDTTVGSLWDYMGFPTGVDPDGAYPIDYPRRAYNLVYNEYYRDETLIAEKALTNESILYRAWEKDYFTSALPWQQRGTAPALPISGTTSAVWADTVFVNGSPGTVVALQANGAAGDARLYTNDADTRLNVKNAFLANTVDLSGATTFTVADLRLAFQIQRWMEANARAGARYVEFLDMHFGVSPKDERLQRPEYLGGARAPVVISEVLQTSSTDATSAQGNLAGHGVVAAQGFDASYRCEEFGLVLGILSIVPKPAYQQGIDRQWLRRTKYDFPFPEFANLSEQAVERAEIYATGVAAENNTVFGFQGRYDECRVKRNMVCGLMRSDPTFQAWHMGRIFTAAPELNETFVNCIPTKRIFAVTTEPGLIVNFANRIRAIRPLPVDANPGLIDHV